MKNFNYFKRRFQVLIYPRLPEIRKVLGILIVVFIFYGIYSFARPMIHLGRQLLLGPKTAFSVVFNRDGLKSTLDKTNILLLGVPGGIHEGADLTDSLIFISINRETGKIITLSLPRDLWLNSMKAKINTAYHYGEEKKTGGGLILTKSAVSEVLGQPVHYAVKMDFTGFMGAIDLVGGIDIEVEKGFDDFKFPILGMENAEPEELRYEHIHFEKGLQTMSGETALKFVRSRNAEGDEGTDFSRSHRQQKVLLAFKDKVLSMQTLLNVSKMKELADIFGESIETDIKTEEYPHFLKLFLKFNSRQISADSLENFLSHPPIAKIGQWVLEPKTGNWQEIHDYVKKLLEE